MTTRLRGWWWPEKGRNPEDKQAHLFSELVVARERSKPRRRALWLVFGAGGGQTKVETPKTSMTLVFGASGGKGKVETQKTSITGSSSGLVPCHVNYNQRDETGRVSPPCHVEYK